MSTLTFTIQPELFTPFPALTVHGLRVENMRKAIDAVQAEALLLEAVQACDIDPEKVAEDPQVAAWREAYGMMGVKPSKFRSSIEALLRRAAKKGDIAIPVALVNLYNACSIITKAPMGAYDIDRLGARTKLDLRKARPESDRFEPLGGEASAFPLNPNLVVYGADDDVMCWGFNCRDSKLAALTAECDCAVFCSEAALPIHQAPALAALELLRDKLLAMGAQCSLVQMANRERPEFRL